MLAGLTQLICVWSVSCWWAWLLCIFFACVVSAIPFACPRVSWVSAGPGLFRLGWSWAAQFCFMCVILPPSILECWWQRQRSRSETKPLCVSDFHVPFASYLQMFQWPKHATCLSPESTGGEELCPPMPSVCYIWLRLIPSSLLCVWTSLQFRECRFWRFPLPSSLLLAERISKLYTFYQFTYIYTLAQN